MSNMAVSGNLRFSHAAPQDFCAIFKEDMGLMYSLAFLLTADNALAEQCFLAALDDCLNRADVFPERARSWSRRAIVKQAIRLVNPLHNNAESASDVSAEAVGESLADVRARLLQLAAFERFVFAMAVLERYSIYECAALLNCSAGDVERARLRALQFISGVGRELQPARFAGTSSQGNALMANIGAA